MYVRVRHGEEPLAVEGDPKWKLHDLPEEIHIIVL